MPRKRHLKSHTKTTAPAPHVENLYGVLVNIKTRENAYVFPLCDLKAANEKSANFTLIDDYAVWFANR